MNEAQQRFVDQLKGLGYDPEVKTNDIVIFEYTVEVGPLTGETVRLGLRLPPDLPLNPPAGPCVSPRILPLTRPGQSADHPYGGVHEANDMGPDFEYWSRPFPGWPQTIRSAAAYMGHIRNLFATLPDDLQLRTHD